MPMRLVLLGLLLLLGCAPGIAQSTCSSTPRVQILADGSLSSVGRARLDVALPVVDGPFSVQVRGGLPLAPAFLIIGYESTPVRVPFLDFDFFPSVPEIAKEFFVLDSQGDSPLQLQAAAMPADLCGEDFVVQAFFIDPAAFGALASTEAVEFRVGTPFMPTPELDDLPRATAATSVLVSGSATRPGATIQVMSPEGVVTGSADGNGRFMIDTPLKQNFANRLFVTEELGGGVSTAPTTAQVIQDSEPPSIFVDFPSDGDILSMLLTNVSGRVADRLSGFLGLEVTVNGVPAIVNRGIGTNGTFDLANFALEPSGTTMVDVIATDAVGNTARATTQVTYRQPAGYVLQVLAGGSQTGQSGDELTDPIEVLVTRPDGSPFGGKLVSFEIVRSNGSLAAAAGGSGEKMLQVFTDSNGVAQAFWRLGAESGCGNNRVRVTSTDAGLPVFFCASALENSPRQINIGTGNGQVGAIGNPLAESIAVWVHDTRNGVPNVPVRFQVIEGDGSLSTTGIAGTADEIVVDTNATGHASVRWTMGPLVGNQRVQASIDSTSEFSVVFDAKALDAILQDTRFSGLVLANTQEPIQGVTCRLDLMDGSSLTTTTDVEGNFAFDGIQVVGPAHFHLDGATATHLAGRLIAPGSVRIPPLEFEPVLFANADNELSRPVQLPLLDPANDVVFDGTQDVCLQVAGIAGLKMFVPASTTVTRPDGTIVGPGDPETLSLNQVHTDDIPMPMPDGTDPPFAWTLQPAGLRFDPPLQIEYPNMSSLPPNAVAYFLSFDHDTGKFEIVASGAVTEDGSLLKTDPGVGLTVSGWGCNCPPYSVTGSCEQCSETCIDNGSLSSGSVTGSPSTEACVGDTISFSASGVSDSGGMKERVCDDGTTEQISVPPGAIMYSYTVSGPSGSMSGMGSSVSLTAMAEGTYTASFTAETMRECAPGSISVGSASVTVNNLCNCMVEIQSPPTDELCAGENVTFTAVGTPAGGTFSWSGGMAQGSTTSSSYTTQFMSAGTQTVTVMYTCMSQSGMMVTESASASVEVGFERPLGSFQRTFSLEPRILREIKNAAGRRFRVQSTGAWRLTGALSRKCCPNEPIIGREISGNVNGNGSVGVGLSIPTPWTLPLPRPLNVGVNVVVNGSLTLAANGTVRYRGSCDPAWEASGSGSLGGSVNGGLSANLTQYIEVQGVVAWGFSGTYVFLGGNALQARGSVSQTGLVGTASIQFTNPLTSSRTKYEGSVVLISPGQIGRFTETIATSL